MKQTKKHFNIYLTFLLIILIVNSNFVLASNEVIKDELVEATLKNKNLKIEKYQKPYFNDDLTQFLEYVEKPSVKDPFIHNEDIFYLHSVKKPYINMDGVIKNEDIKNLSYDKTYIPDNVNNTNFQDTLSFLTIKPIKKISAKNCRLGQYIEFQTVGDIKFKNHLIKDGTSIIGRITNITQNGFAGTPSDITVERFQFKDKSIRNIKLEGVIEKHGANRSIWVVPLVSAGNIFTGIGGYAFYIIKGGHAMLKTRDNFELELLQLQN